MINGISSFIKSFQSSPIPILFIWGFNKKIAVYEIENGPLPKTEFASTIILEYSSSKNVKKKSVCYLKHSFCGILLQQTKLAKIPISNKYIPENVNMASELHNGYKAGWVWEYMQKKPTLL